MGKCSSSYDNHNCVHLLFLFLLSSNNFFQLATCGSIVKFLPGFKGPLPFVLETGYVGVGKIEDVQVFYYFIESENKPKEDPLIVWLSGGPGLSSLSSLLYEIGPLAFKKEEYNGKLPNLVLRPYSWTKVSNIIFVDVPVYTGFTYPTTETGAQRSDWLLIHQAHEFLRKWLVDHPKYQSNEVYFGGESYSGIPIPVIVQEISQANEKGVQPLINLQGYLLGNPKTTGIEENYEIPFAHGMGLISDELYQSLQKNCKGEYMNADTTNIPCVGDLNSFKEATSGLNKFHILDLLCDYDIDPFSGRSSLIQKYTSKFFNTHLKVPTLNCWNYEYILSGYWANDDNVRKALHIRKGSIGKWHHSSFNIPYKNEIFSSFDYHVNLSKKGYRSLIYSGDHDMMIPSLSSQVWIRSLNYSIVDDWRPWRTNGQISGYTRTYSNRMTFATLKGGGHIAPKSRPEECFVMYSKWINRKAL